MSIIHQEVENYTKIIIGNLSILLQSSDHFQFFCDIIKARQYLFNKKKVTELFGL